VKRVDCEFEVGVGADLSSPLAALERGDHRSTSRGDDVTVEAFGEIGIVLDIGNEPRDDVAAGWLREDGDEPGEQGADVLPRRSAGGWRGDDIGAREIRLEHEGGARGPPAVDRLLSHARPSRDGLDGHIRVPALDQQLPGRGDDRLV